MTFWIEYFQVNVMELSADDQVLGYGELGNFSVAGFEMVLNRWQLWANNDKCSSSWQMILDIWIVHLSIVNDSIVYI